MTVALTVVSSLASAAAAGALLVGLLVILPLLLSLPIEHYPRTNTFVLARMDKLMPVTVGTAALSGATLIVLLDEPVRQVFYAVGAIAFLGVVAVSAGILGPVNATVRAIDTTAPPPDWRGLRRKWRTWHWVRVALGQIGAILYAASLAAAL